MSRRYGRNQKRRAREELVELRTTLAETVDAGRSWRDTYHRLDHLLKEHRRIVDDVLGEYSVFHVEPTDYPGWPEKDRRMLVQRSLASKTSWNPHAGGMIPEQQVDAMYADLELFELEVKRLVNEDHTLMLQVAFRNIDQSKPVVQFQYGVSLDLLGTSKFPHQMYPKIIKELSRRLTGILSGRDNNMPEDFTWAKR